MALSLAEKDPDTFAYFEEHHPELAAWLQRATWLTKYKNMTEIDWEEALAYTERQLYPPQDSRRKVGVAVSLALAASAVVGGIGYKIQSDRNAIAIAQKALEEKMNAIRLRVTQTKEMPESTIEEMEAKISFILQTKQFLNGQKELDPSLNIDAEISELDRVLDSINRLLFDALIVSIEEKLRTFDVKNVGEDYFQKIYDQFARLKELDVRKQNNEQISMLEKKVELFNVGWCLSVEEQRYVSFPREDKESNPRAQIVFRQAVSLAREFIDIYIQLPHRTEFVSSGKIPDDKIVASTNLHEVNDYVREIMAMPFPENFRMAAEYIQRVAHVSQNMSLDRNSMMELFAHSLFKMVRWLGGIGFQKLHSYPAEIQANNLVDELLSATECSLLMLRRYNEGLDTVFGENEWSLLLELRKKPNKTSLELEQLRTLERLNEINYMNLQIVLNYLKLHHLKSINY